MARKPWDNVDEIAEATDVKFSTHCKFVGIALALVLLALYLTGGLEKIASAF